MIPLSFLFYLFVVLVSIVGVNCLEKEGGKLILTPYIKARKLEEARNLSLVRNLSSGIISYSGYFNVDQECHSNLFFWFFPAAYGNGEAPLILWHGGGPGSSGLLGLFVENGPFIVEDDGSLHLRDNSWTLTRSVIYFDSPVATGFSETDEREECQITSTMEAGRQIYDAMTQFYTVWPEFVPNKLFIFTGSYGGKFGPAIAHEIHLHNGQKHGDKPEVIMNLQGVLISSGFFDPLHQIDYGSFYYNFGLIDKQERDYFIEKESQAKECINTGNWSCAFNIIEPLIIGMDGVDSHLKNVTGLDFIYNGLKDYKGTPSFMRNHEDYLNRKEIREILHVDDSVGLPQGPLQGLPLGGSRGGKKYSTSNSKVYISFKQDIYQSVKPIVEELLNTGLYKILISSAQLDLVVPHSTVANFVEALNWADSSAFRQERMKIWETDEGNVGGYAKTKGQLTYLYLRNAGHIWIKDQPKWSYQIMMRFTGDKDLFKGNY